MRRIKTAFLGAAASGLLCALWRACGRSPVYTRARYRRRLPPQIPPPYYALEGHECVFAEWEQPTTRRRGGLL